LKRNIIIALATADTDFGHVPAEMAKAEAMIIANEEGKAVTPTRSWPPSSPRAEPPFPEALSRFSGVYPMASD
jgi:hypothetical protein